MEEQRNILELLNQIPQPGFLVRENRITAVNQAAAALLLSPGQEVSGLLHCAQEEYAAFQDGTLSLTLSIAETVHCATVTRLADQDFFLLEQDSGLEEFRSMALVAMQLRIPLMQAIAHAQKQTADEKLNQSLMQMLRLISNMSDISRYTASSRMETRDMDAFLLELFEKAQALTSGKATLTYEGLRQPIFTLMDPEQLERSVWNILSNCMKFMPEGGTIHAKLTRQGQLLRLTVEDSGSCIAENVRTDLFSRYLRQPGIEDGRYGLGLGLAIVRTAARNHGGTVLISKSRRGGTKITMTLSIRQDGGTALRSPVFRPDYSGGWDHGLVELSDCLPSAFYRDL